MLSLFSLYHSVRTQPMWQDIWFINCYFVIGFRWKDDGKQVIASQAGSTVSTPHPQNWSLIGSHRWRGGKLSHFDRSFFCHNEMPTKIQRPGIIQLVLTGKGKCIRSRYLHAIFQNWSNCKAQSQKNCRKPFTISFYFNRENHVTMKWRLIYRALANFEVSIHRSAGYLA